MHPSGYSQRHTPSSVTLSVTTNSLAPLGAGRVLVIEGLCSMDVGSGGLIGEEVELIILLMKVEAGASNGCKLCILIGIVVLWKCWLGCRIKSCKAAVSSVDSFQVSDTAESQLHQCRFVGDESIESAFECT